MMQDEQLQNYQHPGKSKNKAILRMATLILWLFTKMIVNLEQKK